MAGLGQTVTLSSKQNPGSEASCAERALRDSLETRLGFYLLNIMYEKHNSLYAIENQANCYLANSIYRSLPKVIAQSVLESYNGKETDLPLLSLAKIGVKRFLEFQNVWSQEETRLLVWAYLCMTKADRRVFLPYWRKGKEGPLKIDKVISWIKFRRPKKDNFKWQQLSLKMSSRKNVRRKSSPQIQLATFDHSLHETLLSCQTESMKAQGNRAGHIIPWEQISISRLEIVGLLLLELETHQSLNKNGEFPIRRSLTSVCRLVIQSYCIEKGCSDASDDKKIFNKIFYWMDSNVLYRTKKCSTGEGLSYYSLSEFGVRLLEATEAYEKNKND